MREASLASLFTFCLPSWQIGWPSYWNVRATEKERCVLRKVRKFVAKIQIISYITTLPDKLKTRIVRLNVNSEEKDRVYVSDFHNYYIGIRIERRLTRVQKEQKQSYRFAEQRGRSIPPSPWLCVMIIALPNYRVELKGRRGGGRGRRRSIRWKEGWSIRGTKFISGATRQILRRPNFPAAFPRRKWWRRGGVGANLIELLAVRKIAVARFARSVTNYPDRALDSIQFSIWTDE